jgi:hypothetical protein
MTIALSCGALVDPPRAWLKLPHTGRPQVLFPGHGKHRDMS